MVSKKQALIIYRVLTTKLKQIIIIYYYRIRRTKKKIKMRVQKKRQLRVGAFFAARRIKYCRPKSHFLPSHVKKFNLFLYKKKKKI